MNTKKSNFITVNLLLIVLLAFNFQFLTFDSFAQNVCISPTGAKPNENALLDINVYPSNNKGLLLPRLTTANRDAITAPIPLSLLIFNTTTQCFEAWNGTAWVAFGCIGPCVGVTPPSGYGIVESSGKCWLDRNLGATQVATSSTDANAYGDLYQWGRLDDGHQVRTSETISTLSSTDNPSHGNFILSTSNPRDWRNPRNNNLWQGVSGANNPCPSGYRLPTEAEWDAERTSWDSNNAADDAYGSPLKLPVAGIRYFSDGSLLDVGKRGSYWSSTVYNSYSRGLNFDSGNANMSNNYRTIGFSVRCIKE